MPYVAGNHDTVYRAHPPEGCDDIDGRVRVIDGLRIAGLARNLRYNADPQTYQYTERQMAWRLRRLGCQIRRTGGVDLVVSHATPLHADPAFG